MHKFFELLFEIFGWFKIFIGPSILGLGIGAAIYFPSPSVLRLIMGMIVAALGLGIGAFIATKAFKGKGTGHLLARVAASPDLDRIQSQNSSSQD